MPAPLRPILAALALAGLACSPGGGSRSPDGAEVYRFQTNDYEVEYDGQQKRTTIGPGLMRMVRFPEDIVISGGTLRVGDRDYGAVAIKDKVSVVGRKVAVNGQVRRAAIP